MKWQFLILTVLGVAAGAPAAGAQQAGGLTIWDLALGAHARELPAEAFVDYACGTRYGPPALPLADWTEFAKCRAEADTGLHEVYFRYDDEPEYLNLARYPDTKIIDPSTTAYDNPVIVSALFDNDGFYVGFRLVTDPRADLAYRERGYSLSDRLLTRYNPNGFACENLPRLERESPFQGMYLKRRCDATKDGVQLYVESHLFRKAGQTGINHDGPTEGLFESSTHFQAVLTAPVPEREARLAALTNRPLSERDQRIARARDCAGCDLRGVDLKRANLTGANLAGADLTGANLHGANLARADLTGAVLLNANLNRADLRLAVVKDATLAGVMLYAARFDGADLSGSNLDGILAGKVVFARANLANASMMQADVRQGRLNDANFAGANLTASLFDDVQMTRSVLAGAQLVSASLWRINLIGADLSGIDAREADFSNANLRDADLSGADFSDAQLRGVNLSATRREGANFAGAELPAGFTLP